MDKMKFIYRPVPSRRLGISLGISPIPKKTCNYSCIYCQFEIESFLDTRNCSDITNIFNRLNEDKEVNLINYKGYDTYRLK